MLPKVRIKCFSVNIIIQYSALQGLCSAWLSLALFCLSLAWLSLAWLVGDGGGGGIFPFIFHLV